MLQCEVTGGQLDVEVFEVVHYHSIGSLISFVGCDWFLSNWDGSRRRSSLRFNPGDLVNQLRIAVPKVLRNRIGVLIGFC